MLWWTLRQLASGDSQTRVRAIRKLGQSKDTRALHRLRNALHDTLAVVRVAVIRALTLDVATVATDLIEHSLGDSDSDVRREAAEALARYRWSPRNEEQRVAYAIARQNWAELETIGKPAVEALIAHLNDRSYAIRTASVRLLMQIGDEHTIRPLVDCAKKDAQLSSMAVAALEQVLARSSDHLAIADLRIVVGLEDIVHVIRVPYTGPWAFEMNDSSPGPPPDYVNQDTLTDCARVRLLALEELQRRGESPN